MTPNIPPTIRIDASALTGRVAGFVAHLRLNDFALGPAESAAALALLGDLDPCDPREVRLGLKSLLAGRKGVRTSEHGTTTLSPTSVSLTRRCRTTTGTQGRPRSGST